MFKNAPVRRGAFAMNTNSAFRRGSYSDNPFWYEQFDLRQIIKLRSGELIVEFDVVYNCSVYVTTMKAMSFQDDNPSLPFDNFKNHYLLVFDLTSMQDGTEKCHSIKLVGVPLRRELNFTFAPEHVPELNDLGNESHPLQLTRFVLLEKTLFNG